MMGFRAMVRTLALALLALLLSAATASAEDAMPTALPAAPGTEAEPNDTTATATPIEAGERIRAPRTVGDVDHYRFTAEAGDRVFAAVVTSVSVGSPDSELALLGSDGTTVLESDDDNGSFGTVSSSIAGTTIPASGTYYLRVDGSAGAANQFLPYDLVLDVHSGEPTPEVEPNDEASNAQPLGVDRLVSGTKAPNERDLYTIELGAGDTVFLSLDLDPERDGASFNGRLAFGDAEQLLAVNDIGTADAIPSEAFVSTVPRAGVYNLLVDSANAVAGQSGAYLLSITVIRAVERSCRTYSISPSQGAIADRAATTFPIDVTDAATIDHMAVRLDLTHNFMADLDATLEAPAGNRVALFDDIGSGTAGQFTQMQATFDDNAGLPPQYQWLKGVALQPESYRLGWFAGQQAAGTWKLTLRDDATEDVGTLAGADLILCARPDEGPTETVFAAAFESGDDGFEHSGAADEWERGTPATAEDGNLAGLTRCAEGTGCFKTDLDGTYDASSSQDLVSPPIPLEGRTGQIYASWEMWYQLERQPFEHFTVSVEEDGGANARPLFSSIGADMHRQPWQPERQPAAVRRLGPPPRRHLRLRGQDDPPAVPPGLRQHRAAAGRRDRRRARLPADVRPGRRARRVGRWLCGLHPVGDRLRHRHRRTPDVLGRAQQRGDAHRAPGCGQRIRRLHRSGVLRGGDDVHRDARPGAQRDRDLRSPAPRARRR